MDRFIISENIRRFELLLAKATEPGQRDTLASLLDAERRKLATPYTMEQPQPGSDDG